MFDRFLFKLCSLYRDPDTEHDRLMNGGSGVACGLQEQDMSDSDSESGCLTGVGGVGVSTDFGTRMAVAHCSSGSSLIAVGDVRLCADGVGSARVSCRVAGFVSGWCWLLGL